MAEQLLRNSVSKLRKDRPWNFFRRNRLNINQWRRQNFDDVVLANGIGLSTRHQFSNYWDIYWSN